MAIDGVASVGAWIPKTDAQAFFQKSAADTAARADLAGTPRKLVATSEQATASANIQPASIPASQSVTDTYKVGSPESENVSSAVSAVKIGRTYMETVNFGAGMYNNAKKALEDTAYLDNVKQKRGEEGLAKWVKSLNRLKNFGAELVAHGQANINKNFTSTASVVSSTPDSLFKANDFTLEAKSQGWSVQIKSDGNATAKANGVDVSDQIADTSSTGFKWSDVASKPSAGTTDQAVALATLTKAKDLATSLLNDGDEKFVSPSQKPSGSIIDVAA